MMEEKFEYYNIFEKEEKFSCGTIKIKSIDFNPKYIEDLLSKIVLNKENLAFMFMTSLVDCFDYRRALERFIPEKIETDYTNYVIDALDHNHNFYSFFAEGLLTLILKDIYDWNLTTQVIDINDTLNDSHTGVDACLYDKKNSIYIMGEAKFYKDFKSALDKIINDFTGEHGFFNKISSFKKRTTGNRVTHQMIIRDLQEPDCKRITIDQFLSQQLSFVGFVLHENNVSIDKYSNGSLYQNIKIKLNDLIENLQKCVDNPEELEIKVTLYLLNLPISNKKDLIVKVIEEAKKRLDEDYEK